MTSMKRTTTSHKQDFIFMWNLGLRRGSGRGQGRWSRSMGWGILLRKTINRWSLSAGVGIQTTLHVKYFLERSELLPTKNIRQRSCTHFLTSCDYWLKPLHINGHNRSHFPCNASTPLWPGNWQWTCFHLFLFRLNVSSKKFSFSIFFCRQISSVIKYNWKKSRLSMSQFFSL